MKKKCKILFSILVIFSVLVGTGAPVAYAEDLQEMSFIEQYWAQISEVLSMKHDESFFDELERERIYYSYQGEKRVSKTVNDVTTYFEYNEAGQVTEERTSAVTIRYQYDDYGNLSAVGYNDAIYYAETDLNGSVAKLFNEDEECVAEYVYINGVASISSEDKGGAYDLHIGEINKVRFCSFYYDEETGYYYTGGYLYDTVKGKYVGKLSEDAVSEVDCNVSLKRDSVILLADSVTQWANSLLYGDPDYGEAKPAVLGWYEDLSDVEILARLIYGENPKNRQDQKAVMWVLFNRVQKSWYPNTLREVATATGQFATITGYGSQDARTPAVGSEKWRHATWLACALCTATDENVLQTLVNKPGGIDEQTSFRALYNFVERCEDSPQGIVLNYSDGRKSRLINVVIVGDLGEIEELQGNNNQENSGQNYFDMNSHVINADTISDLNLYIGSIHCVGDRLSWNHTKEAYHNIFFTEIVIN